MALNSVKFRIEGDGTSALKALRDVKGGMQDLRDVVSKEVSSKIKQLFSVAAIEEMTRRTAEWATNVSKTAQKLQVTTDELQGFQLAARKINMDEGKIEGFFSTMEDAARDALKGNMELIQSFARLKISMSDLRTLNPSALFSKVLGGLGTTAGLEGAIGIFGRGETQDLRLLSQAVGGKTGAQLAEENKSQIVPSEDIVQLRAAWTSLLQGLVEIKNKFVPLVSLITNIVSGLVQMASGTIGMITRGLRLIGFGIGGLFGSESAKNKYALLAEESQGAFSSTMSGIRNSLKGMVNFGASLFGAEPQFTMEEKPPDVDERVWREAQGTGGLIAAIGTGGARGVTGKGPAGLSGVAGGIWGKLADLQPKLVSQLLMRGKVRINSMADVERLWKEAGLGEFTAPKNMIDAGNILDKIQSKMVGAGLTNEEILAKFVQGISTGGAAGSALGITGNMGVEEAKKIAELQGGIPFKGRQPFVNFGQFGAGGGDGGSANLRIGGVFGTDVSFKILSLNQEMVNIMSRMLAIMEENRNPAPYVQPTGLH